MTHGTHFFLHQARLVLVVLAMAFAMPALGHDVEGEGRREAPRAALAAVPDKAQAVLADVMQCARVCGQRPERLSSGSRFGGPSQQYVPRVNHLSHLQKSLFGQYRGYGTVLSSPATVVPVCRYYIYALGHLLC